MLAFQSAPRSCERGDGGFAAGEGVEKCFNPRPARVSGATAGDMPGIDSVAGFNPRPARVSGATINAAAIELHEIAVSIRAPLV